MKRTVKKKSSNKLTRTRVKLVSPTRKPKPPVDIVKKKEKKVERDARGYLLPGTKSLNPGGRGKGTMNKFTTLKIAFLKAFEKLGGVDGLYQWAQYSPQNMRVFYQMVARMLPREINLGDSDIKPNDLSSLRDEELDAIIAGKKRK